MKVRAQLKNYRMSPQKVRTVARILRGRRVDDALLQLQMTTKKSTDALEGLIRSAAANAENNFQLDGSTLVIADVMVDEGTKLKRWMPRAHGRATKIIKRMCHVVVILESNEQSKKVSKPEKKKDSKEVKKAENDSGALKAGEEKGTQNENKKKDSMKKLTDSKKPRTKRNNVSK